MTDNSTDAASTSEDAPTTPALDALAESGLDYKVVRHGEVDSLEEAAAARGLDPRQVLKTLVVRRGEGDFLFILVPGDRQISWPKVREHLGIKRVSMPDATVAQEVTGYVRGTITPFGSRFSEAGKPWPVIADALIASRAADAVAGQGETTEGETPQGETPQGETAQGETPHGESARGESEQGTSVQGEVAGGRAAEGKAPQGKAAQVESVQGETAGGSATEGKAASFALVSIGGGAPGVSATIAADALIAHLGADVADVTDAAVIYAEPPYWNVTMDALESTAKLGYALHLTPAALHNGAIMTMVKESLTGDAAATFEIAANEACRRLPTPTDAQVAAATL
ncbi:aminoacyl-tRNA deacylase [Demequina aurantiaca]|uniref:aminoacyl-tRNA deacylase n=1 Tax=Demequina aurantiaca TaxID=676200 RepID=UPI003D34EF75